MRWSVCGGRFRLTFMPMRRLTGSGRVPKKTRKPKKRLGRPEMVKPEELLNRYHDLKEFLEQNWGRIGWALQRVRKPADVRKVLELVPRVEFRRPFNQEPAVCLLEDGEIGIKKRELDRMRQQYRDAAADEDRLRWSEHHVAFQKAEDATTALKSIISEFGLLLRFYPFIFVTLVLAKKLEVDKLRNTAIRLKEALSLAQEKKTLLHKQLRSRNAWFARNEIVEFRKSERYEKNAINLTKAMAGLPEYKWLHSFRKCSKFQDESAPAPGYLLFELIKAVVKKIRPINLGRIEKKLQIELLRDDTDPRVRGYVEPNWAYLRQAIAECRGKGFKRAELPYKMMGKFLDNVERPKTMPEIELAKQDQLVKP